MKKHITAVFKTVMIVFVSFFFAQKTFANDEPSVEKKKVINKTYPISSKQKLYIKNSFGEVVVNNYKGNEVKVEVSITVKASNEERAQNLLDNITVNDNNGSTISFETKIGNTNNRGRKGESQSMEINYQVYVPESNTLEVVNEFGKTFLGDRTGTTNLTQKFGDLEIGTLSNLESVTVEFGKLKANKLSGGKSIFKYSEVVVNSFSGDLKSSFEFCKKTKIGLNSDVTDVDIKNSYSDIEITVPVSFNGTYNIKTSFGDFYNNTDFKIKDVDEDEDDRGPRFDKTFTGKSGTGAVKVKIKSSFGKIKLKN